MLKGRILGMRKTRYTKNDIYKASLQKYINEVLLGVKKEQRELREQRTTSHVAEILDDEQQE